MSSFRSRLAFSMMKLVRVSGLSASVACHALCPLVSFVFGSLAEPVSCIVGAFHAQYHTQAGSYVHRMGIVESGSLVLLAGVGPMGLGAIDYALHNPQRPSRLVVTDIDDARLRRAQQLLSPAEAARQGVE
ncbi:MAG: hypothetical protein LBB80_04830, partial [Treponema sp.]|nr:hypothetical protein [Treponema sp.]